MLGCIGCEYTRYSRVKTAAEDGGEAGFLETLLVGPLPWILEVCHVLGLIVGGVEIVDSAYQTRIHDGEVLIGESHVDYERGFVAVKQFDELGHAVSINYVGTDIGFADSLDHSLTLGTCAWSYDYLGEYVGMLGAFVGYDGTNAAGSDDYYFCHIIKLSPADVTQRRHCMSWSRVCGNWWLVAWASEETEQIEKQVDKVKIEAQRADSGEVTGHAWGRVLCHLLDFLCVPCGEAYEDKHSGTWDNPSESVAVGEDVDHRGDDEAYERVKQEVAPLGEILCGEVAIDAHGSECAGADKEGLGYWCGCIYYKYGCECQTVERGKHIEEQCSRGRWHLADTGREGEHNHELGDEETPVEPWVGGHELHVWHAAGAEHGEKRGHEQAKCHLEIDTLHHGWCKTHCLGGVVITSAVVRGRGGSVIVHLLKRMVNC